MGISKYLKGLLLPGGRKSVEPMAARVHPQNVRSAHQSMHHLVADADWSDQALLAAVAAQVLPPLSRKSAACHWIVDDTGFSKKGSLEFQVGCRACGLNVWKSSLPAIRKMTVLMVDRRLKPRALRLADWNRPLMASRKPLV
ncbi:putative ISXo8 transposase [Xanthomonas oryzae pv. oryzae KACC 10331]|uniref:ISXo8 transposase n=1 Tax=Xanthomonas oryzae pv. oryzae (strain KACC10331 / KXO85) TaxID=291331 RepID=Q05I17_XANOR|nr:putative ISXo8 transposase [Xanthomonas oryzae pv. oryzae KACC 10331]